MSVEALRLKYIRPMQYADIFEIEKNLRSADRLELEACGQTALRSLKRAYTSHELTNYAILSPMTGRPFGIFGVNGINGIIWMVSTPEIENFKTKFLKGSRTVIETYHKQGIPVLWNWVDARNELHLKWLTKWLGFEITAEGELNGNKYYKAEHRPKEIQNV